MVDESNINIILIGFYVNIIKKLVIYREAPPFCTKLNTFYDNTNNYFYILNNEYFYFYILLIYDEDGRRE